MPVKAEGGDVARAVVPNGEPGEQIEVDRLLLEATAAQLLEIDDDAVGGHAAGHVGRVDQMRAEHQVHRLRGEAVAHDLGIATELDERMGEAGHEIHEAGRVRIVVGLHRHQMNVAPGLGHHQRRLVGRVIDGRMSHGRGGLQSPARGLVLPEHAQRLDQVGEGLGRARVEQDRLRDQLGGLGMIADAVGDQPKMTHAFRVGGIGGNDARERVGGFPQTALLEGKARVGEVIGNRDRERVHGERS